MRCLLLLLVLITHECYGQSTGSLSDTLDVVIVTSQKREESNIKTAASISVINKQLINDLRLWNLNGLTAVVPNLYSADPGDGRNVTSIRGIVSTSYDPAVATYIDGINQFSLDTYDPNLINIKRIEILRGPQGTLYGRNAMGGVINVISNEALTGKQWFLENSYGSFNTYRIVAGGTLTSVNSRFSIGGSILYQRSNGYIQNDFNNLHFDKYHKQGLSSSFGYQFSSQWKAKAILRVMDQNNRGSFPLSADKESAFANPYHLEQNAVASLKDRVLNTSLIVQHNSKKIDFISQSSYQSNYRYYSDPLDGDFSPLDIITIINDYGKQWNNVKVFTEEMRISSTSKTISKWKWLIGSYLFLQTSPNKQATHFGNDAALIGSPLSNVALISTTKGRVCGASLFGQVSYNISERMQLTGGIRYDAQKNKADIIQELYDDASGSVMIILPDTSARVKANAISPLLKLQYFPDQRTQLYFSYAKGFRAGGLTQLGADPSSPPLFAYQPERNNSFELGFKNELVNKKWQFAAAIFYSRINSVQVPTLILPEAVTITRNAGRLKSKGVEASILGLINKHWLLQYNMGYVNATYNKLVLSSNGSGIDYKGNKQIFTPSSTNFIGLEYSGVINRKRQVAWNGNLEYYALGKQYFDLANSISQSAYGLINAKASLQYRKASISIWTRNINDRKYLLYAYDFGATRLGSPREFGITIRIGGM